MKNVFFLVFSEINLRGMLHNSNFKNEIGGKEDKKLVVGVKINTMFYFIKLTLMNVYFKIIFYFSFTYRFIKEL